MRVLMGCLAALALGGCATGFYHVAAGAERPHGDVERGVSARLPGVERRGVAFGKAARPHGFRVFQRLKAGLGLQCS